MLSWPVHGWLNMVSWTTRRYVCFLYFHQWVHGDRDRDCKGAETGTKAYIDFKKLWQDVCVGRKRFQAKEACMKLKRFLETARALDCVTAAKEACSLCGSLWPVCIDYETTLGIGVVVQQSIVVAPTFRGIMFSRSCRVDWCWSSKSTANTYCSSIPQPLYARSLKSCQVIATRQLESTMRSFSSSCQISKPSPRRNKTPSTVMRSCRMRETLQHGRVPKSWLAGRKCTYLTARSWILITERAITIDEQKLYWRLWLLAEECCL